MTTYEILKGKGMITRHYGRECLGYIVDVGNGKREKRTTANLNKDIEVERADTPLEDRRGARLGIVIHSFKTCDSELSTKQIKEDKERAFLAVVIRLQAENLYPKSPIHVWGEENPSSVYVFGECKV